MSICPKAPIESVYTIQDFVGQAIISLQAANSSGMNPGEFNNITGQIAEAFSLLSSMVPSVAASLTPIIQKLSQNPPIAAAITILNNFPAAAGNLNLYSVTDAFSCSNLTAKILANGLSFNNLGGAEAFISVYIQYVPSDEIDGLTCPSPMGGESILASLLPFNNNPNPNQIEVFPDNDMPTVMGIQTLILAWAHNGQGTQGDIWLVGEGIGQFVESFYNQIGDQLTLNQVYIAFGNIFDTLDQQTGYRISSNYPGYSAASANLGQILKYPNSYTPAQVQAAVQALISSLQLAS